jgi:Protein of unknown function (DUF2911)
MKKISLALTLATFALAAQAQIRIPAASPSATVVQGIGLATASIEYSRPALKGRKMFDDQVPYGKVWRTGANRTTKLTISDEMTVGGQKLAAGSYGLFTIPGASEWTIIVSKDAVGPGAFAYKPENDVFRVTAKATKTAAKAEFFTMEFTGFTSTSANLTMRWENTEVSLPLVQDVDAKIMAQIQQETAKPDAKPAVFSAAANYYYDTNRDIKQAREWAEKVVEADKQYWTYYLRAKIAARQGDCKQARADAEASLELAKKQPDEAYIKNNQRILDTCKQ